MCLCRIYSYAGGGHRLVGERRNLLGDIPDLDSGRRSGHHHAHGLAKHVDLGRRTCSTSTRFWRAVCVKLTYFTSKGVEFLLAKLVYVA